MNRSELLAQWAELAPGECVSTARYVGTPPVTIWALGHYDPRPESETLFCAILLSTLIEAIRARGWHYNLYSDETERDNECPTAWHTASIYRTAENVVPKTIAQKAEPCDALLTSYVAALQVQKEKL